MNHNANPSRRAAEPRAFTLIELLIVVAIIAILAAIAVPNFLEAQVRSKVSRVKSDMRTLATAVESYFVDHNAYPTPANEDLFVESDPLAEPFETRTPPLLTTPVAYITSLLNDTFPRADAAVGEPRIFHYSNRAYFLAFDAFNGETTETEFNGYVTYLTGSSPDTVHYFFLSHGPDTDHDEPESGNQALYDPTNGSVSNGDVLFFGPGSGFRK